MRIGRRTWIIWDRLPTDSRTFNRGAFRNRERVPELQFNDMALTARVVTMSQEGIRSLQSANIPFVITKGPGIALEAATLSDRPFIDLDIVVEPSRFVEAQKVLEGIGYFEHSRTQQPWDSLNRFCREAVNLRTGLGASVDLHHRVSPWYWSTGLSQDVLVRDSRFSTLFGVPLRLVSTHHNLPDCGASRG